MASAYTDLDTAVVPSDVYAPREDSQLLIDVSEKTGLAHRSRVADLCTGTGILAITAREVSAAARSVHWSLENSRAVFRTTYNAERFVRSVGESGSSGSSGSGAASSRVDSSVVTRAPVGQPTG
jgi:hypothetical protein